MWFHLEPTPTCLEIKGLVVVVVVVVVVCLPDKVACLGQNSDRWFFLTRWGMRETEQVSSNHERQVYVIIDLPLET
jgi:hypothetical protein